MITLTTTLKHYGLSDKEILLVKRGLKRGEIVRTTYCPEIVSILLDDENNVSLIIIDHNGKEHRIDRSWDWE